MSGWEKAPAFSQSAPLPCWAESGTDARPETQPVFFFLSPSACRTTSAVPCVWRGPAGVGWHSRPAGERHACHGAVSSSGLFRQRWPRRTGASRRAPRGPAGLPARSGPVELSSTGGDGRSTRQYPPPNADGPRRADSTRRRADLVTGRWAGLPSQGSSAVTAHDTCSPAAKPPTR